MVLKCITIKIFIYQLNCGPCAFEYSHKDAVLDNVCRDIRIEIDLYTDKTDRNIFRSIGRAIGNSSNNKILTFHYRSETAHSEKTDVLSFVKKKEQIKEVYRVLDDYRGRLIISEISSRFLEINSLIKELGFKEIEIEYEKTNRWFIDEWVKS